MDEYLHFDEWKTVEEDPYYDWKLVRKVRESQCEAIVGHHFFLNTDVTVFWSGIAHFEEPQGKE